MPRREKLQDRINRLNGDGNMSSRLFTLALQPADPDFMKLREGYYYRFKGAPQQQDPLIKAISEAIKELCADQTHGILMSNTNVRVKPSTTAPPIWPPNEQYPGYVAKFYTFVQDRTEFPATVPVSVRPHDARAPLTTKKLHVRVGGAWIPLKQWLVTLVEPSLLSRHNTTAVTLNWWKRNGRVFRLMNL